MHSCWSDGAQSPEDLVFGASGRVDVLAITDHDEIRGALRARAFAEEHPELGVEVVVGEEVSTLNGHLLALWVKEFVPPRLSAERTIALIHAQGGLAVAAHPHHPLRYNARGHRSLATLMQDIPIDAVEVVNNSGFSSWLYDARTVRCNASWKLAVTGSSDAHDVRYVGSALTRFPGRDAQALRHALLTRATDAHSNWTWTARELPRHFGVKVRSFRRFVIPRRRLQPMTTPWRPSEA